MKVKYSLILMLMVVALLGCKSEEEAAPTDPFLGTYVLNSASILSDGYAQVFEGELLEALLEQQPDMFQEMTFSAGNKLSVDGQTVAERWVRNENEVRLRFNDGREDVVFEWDEDQALTWQDQQQHEEDIYLSQMVFIKK
ncbi:hypothetical protein [Persicobacter psychrovividus]|uniref:Lipocalin-like domain-containing protein n=1 Tax=Persicobacter psychrovividus TaxID=387638 RepID=A0ABM7VF80_9BACT|nr:hypothetical protein PEPS_18790 [Persicobacter psychrovividus]